jgi:phospholipase C
MLVISPWTRANHVSHNLTDTASVTKFIENNWLGGKRIGNGSFDASSGSLNGLFQFFAPNLRPVILNPTTGAVVRQ